MQNSAVAIVTFTVNVLRFISTMNPCIFYSASIMKINASIDPITTSFSH